MRRHVSTRICARVCSVRVMVVVQVKSPTKMHVHLLKKATVDARWAAEPGPLKLVAIDTGGGKLLLRPDVSYVHAYSLCV